MENQYIKDMQKELAKEDSKAGYSNKTRKYLQKRAIRLLVRMGEAGDAAYTAFAREVMLHFSDADDRGATVTQTWEYDPKTRRTTVLSLHHPHFWEYPLLNVLLYRSSPRFELPAGTLKIRYRPGHQPTTDMPDLGGGNFSVQVNYKGAEQPGEEVPPYREEAFPKLWDAAPADLVRLLEENRCSPVNSFAVKAFRSNPARKDHTTVALVKTLLHKPYAESHGLGLELAREVYDANQLDIALLFALLDCPLQEAQQLGLNWLQGAQSKMLQDKAFITRLLLARQPQVNHWAKSNLSATLISSSMAKAVLEEVLQQLLQLQPAEAELAATNAWVAQVADLLLILFPDVLRDLPLPLVEQLVVHPLEEMQSLGVKLLQRSRTRTEALPVSLFEALLASPFAQVRAQGVSLFGQLSDYALYDRREVVVSFCISRHPEVRQQVLPIVARLVKNRASFGKDLIQLLLPLFWQQEAYEGLHLDLLRLFQESLQDFYKDIPEEKVWKLIDAAGRPAHLLGSLLLQKQVALERVPLERLAALADHELLELRQLAHRYFEAHVAQARYEREAALKLLDARWDDSLLFAKRFFEEHFRSEDWTPGLLVSICDHKREEVQQFGLRLITKHFREEDGVEYMLKLSQHPNTRLQQFVANYLNQYASGHPERIEALEYYFTAVLSQVNRGRVAKERVFDFLKKEALASEVVAVTVLPLITRISITMAIRDKALCLQLLARLKEAYPQLDSPITIKALKTV